MWGRVELILEVLGKRGFEVFVPLITDGQVVRFLPLGTKGKLSLGDTLPVCGPKSILFPRNQGLFSFREGPGYTLKTGAPRGRIVIFGVLPCDLVGVQILDEVFSHGYRDTDYLARRGRAILIGIPCKVREKGCFCKSFGIDPGVPRGADIAINQADRGYLLQTCTPKGEEVAQMLRPIGPVRRVRVEDKTPGYEIRSIRDSMMRAWGSEIWKQIAWGCHGCGLCTYICPICSCFDIHDQREGQGGRRFRVWDSCMSSGFTLMASGENPRSRLWERVRQRLFHKFCYLPENIGRFGCVGCGRCVRYCPAGIDLHQIIEGFRHA